MKEGFTAKNIKEYVAAKVIENLEDKEKETQYWKSKIEHKNEIIDTLLANTCFKLLECTFEGCEEFILSKYFPSPFWYCMNCCKLYCPKCATQVGFKSTGSCHACSDRLLSRLQRELDEIRARNRMV